MVKKKASIGRQKIAIQKIPKKNHLQVTFSKRRTGLFKKASELCTLCGVEIAIIVFSPANKAFSFGHPQVESISERFLARNPPPLPPSSGTTSHYVEAHRNANVHELNTQLTQILNQLEVEKKKGEELNQIRKISQSQCWWEAPIDELGLYELQQLREAMLELKKKVALQANKILVDCSNPSPFFLVGGTPHFVDFKSKADEMNNGVSGPTTPNHVNNFGYGHGGF